MLTLNPFSFLWETVPVQGSSWWGFWQGRHGRYHGGEPACLWGCVGGVVVKIFSIGGREEALSDGLHTAKVHIRWLFDAV